MFKNKQQLKMTIALSCLFASLYFQSRNRCKLHIWKMISTEDPIIWIMIVEFIPFREDPI